MKKLAFLLFASVIIFTSCKKEEESITCEYYLTGENCENELRNKLAGTYNGMATDGNLQEPYSFVLKAYSSNPKRMSVSDYYEIELTSAIEFVFVETLQGDAQVSGSGTFIDGKITFVMEAFYQDTNETRIFSYEGNKVE